MGTLSPEALNYLKQQQDQWDKTPTGDSNELPPDGLYVCEIIDFDFFEGKNGDAAGHEFMKTETVVVDGEHRSRPVDFVHNVTNPERFRSLKRHLYAMGLEIRGDELGDLLVKLGAAKGRRVEVNVTTSDRIDERTGKPYRNAFVNGVLSDPAQSDLSSDAPVPVADGGASDDDIPF